MVLMMSIYIMLILIINVLLSHDITPFRLPNYIIVAGTIYSQTVSLLIGRFRLGL